MGRLVLFVMLGFLSYSQSLKHCSWHTVGEWKISRIFGQELRTQSDV